MPAPKPTHATHAHGSAIPTCLQQAQGAHDSVEGQVVCAGSLVLAASVQPHCLASDVDHRRAAAAALGAWQVGLGEVGG